MSKADKIDFLLQHITSLLTRSSDQILQEQLGVGYSQFKILRVIGTGLPVKQRFIADTLGQTEASISRQINLLIAKGLITKTKDPTNKRSRLITVTIKGVKLTEAALTVLNKYHNNTFSDANDKKKTFVLEGLEELHQMMCSIDHSPSAEYMNYLSSH